jgi:molybdate transport system substrate-binding protein
MMKSMPFRSPSLFPVIATLTAFLVLSGCRSSESNATNSPELVVSAAVSLKDAFKEIAAIVEKQTRVKVRFNFGASGALQKQIEAGAPADVFASAGAKQMDELSAQGLIIESSKQNFARNVLVLVVPIQQVSISSFADLNKPEVRKIAVGNPKTVPAGQYTEQTFTSLKLLPQIQSKLIYAEDVRQVLDYVARGEVDAGVVYASDTLSAGTKVKEVTRAPEDSHGPILYPIAIIKESHEQEAAQKFIDVVVSAEGQKILAEHGFGRE